MQAILLVTLPFFALVLAGWVAASRGWLPAQAIPGLNAFVLFFALPAMLFRFGRSTPIGQLLDPVLLALWILCALVIVVFTVALTLGPRVRLKDAAFGALVAAFPNTGFMGVPLLVALLGPSAAGPAITTILVDIFITTSVCIGIAQAHGAAGQGPRVAVGRALRGAAGNPLPWAVALGALWGAMGWQLPAPADRVITMLADAASPVALFTIGAVLWRTSRGARSVGAAHGDEGGPAPAPQRPAGVWPVVAVKLLLHPTLVLLSGASAISLGLPLDRFALMVVTLVAALPSASNVSLLTERYGADTGRVARIILITTVAAFGTFAFVGWVFGIDPSPR
jgi:malonate transporter